jgi:hypothetical protein
VVPGGDADGRRLEPARRRPVSTARGQIPVLLTPPASLALPGLDHSRRATSAVQEAAQQAWPAIETLVQQGRAGVAAQRMEALADRMRQAAPADPDPWQKTLTEYRAILYDDLAYLARLPGGRKAAEAALLRCRERDAELGDHLDGLIEAVRAMPDQPATG